jgi:cell division septum initiation protein DivIVA
MDKLISYNASIYSGTLIVSKDTKQILENIQKTEAQIIELKNKIKKETNFNEKVNMNMELKKMNDKLKDLKEDLK